jgi:hypothetical protein
MRQLAAVVGLGGCLSVLFLVLVAWVRSSVGIYLGVTAFCLTRLFIIFEVYWVGGSTNMDALFFLATTSPPAPQPISNPAVRGGPLAVPHQRLPLRSPARAGEEEEVQDPFRGATRTSRPTLTLTLTPPSGFTSSCLFHTLCLPSPSPPIPPQARRHVRQQQEAAAAGAGVPQPAKADEEPGGKGGQRQVEQESQAKGPPLEQQQEEEEDGGEGEDGKQGEVLVRSRNRSSFASAGLRWLLQPQAKVLPAPADETGRAARRPAAKGVGDYIEEMRVGVIDQLSSTGDASLRSPMRTESENIGTPRARRHGSSGPGAGGGLYMIRPV